MTEFIKAALPWIVLGIAVAIAAAQIGTRKKKKDNGNYMSVGMCFGMCAGVILGATEVLPLSYGISFGLLLGITIGICVKRNDNEKEVE